ncbi:Hsp70 family protein [Streptomyces sp. NPDC086549]|uniref:Hsp70 family protein n=1 Tax=Streptomyces sp. NPDC086549 TaxID=3365752 RepID=UPI0037F25A1C
MVDDAFGIDFGTTNSVLARASATAVEAVALDDRIPAEWANTGLDLVLPSVMAFEDESPVFGWAAKNRHDERLEAVKRLLAATDSVTVGARTLPIETAGAMFFRHIQQRAAAGGLTAALDRAVVTIPANSRGLARYRTKLAAGLAGIEVAALINEPTAAAMAHARTIGQDQRILVFDWGGGTLDVTVLESVDGAFIEQASKGIQRLGGIDVDQLFAAAVLPRISGAADWTPARRNLFRLNLERAKVELSRQEETQVALPGGGFVRVTRQELEESIKPIVERTRGPVEVCLRDSPGAVDHLVMVGGSSKMPVIRRFVTDLVHAEPSEGVDPITAVAEGAAVAAGILSGSITDLDFFVGTEHALGVVVHNDHSAPEGDFSTLIARNTKYPARATDYYVPGKDYQEAIDIVVVEGDPGHPIRHEDNVVLKNWTVPLPAKRRREESAFSVTYEYDIDGILHVEVTDQQSGDVFMRDELTYGTGQERSRLPELRRQVDEVMSSVAPAGPASADPAPAGPLLAPASAEAIRKARDKVLPFLDDAERDAIGELVGTLERSGGSPEEEDHRLALERALRRHAYLL